MVLELLLMLFITTLADEIDFECRVDAYSIEPDRDRQFCQRRSPPFPQHRSAPPYKYMNQLHVYFALRNRQAFQRLLESSVDRGQSISSAASLSSSNAGGGKSMSWSKSSSSSSSSASSPAQYYHCDVNARDWLGRTVLHIACACASADSQSAGVVEYVRLLLAHPAINVNIFDTESHWTALHRALYHGNIATALLLLKRSDIDTSLKDLEGYTAFDLYNSTLEGTKPSPSDTGRVELFTWGINRNATLGLGDADDRAHPDQVVIHQKGGVVPDLEKQSLHSRFSPIEVRQVTMSRLHTVLVTSENVGNLRVCGFGSGGRLGHTQHTQYHLKPLPHFEHTIISVALGQDHTLALTKSGEVLSWGLNRFSQLGYVVEHSSANASSARLEEPIQSSPRKVHGHLRKEIVRGVAASKCASACWTDREVFTWGTNNGQLGYDKAIQNVQVLPRKVTKVTQPVISLTLTDSAMACLLATHEVVCIWNDRHSRIRFPSHAFPSEIQVYRPPQALRDAHIVKITSCDDTFAALSSNGEVFTFTLPRNSEGDGPSIKDRAVIKPQRVWALRKQFCAARDVALGADGSIIICTESGHVFVRTRTSRGSVKSIKFQRIPYIQRVTNVCANNTGSFGALRVEYKPEAIVMDGNTLTHDLAEIQPYLRSEDDESPPPTPTNAESSSQADSKRWGVEVDNGEENDLIEKDIYLVRRLCSLIAHDDDPPDGPPIIHGADIIIQTSSGLKIPAHRVMLAARAPVLHDMLSGSPDIRDEDSSISISLLYVKCLPMVQPLPRLVCSGCHAISLLVLLTYLYCDNVPTVWDRCVASALAQDYTNLGINPNRVKVEVQALARLLGLPLLANAVESPAKRPPVPSLGADIAYLLQTTQNQDLGHSSTATNARSDVVLQLADKDMVCHSMVLRARSPFFADFFDDPDWTINRWNVDGTIQINMKHIKERVMLFVLRFIYGDEDLFTTLEFVNSVDDILEFVFEVMAVANELLLDRLVVLCSTVILKYTNITTACYSLADATHFHSPLLVESLHSYIAANMEIFLENHMLDDMPVELIYRLAKFVRKKQADKSPVSRSNQIVETAMQNQSDWLALQDIPQPIIQASRHGLYKLSPKLSPSSPNKKPHRRTSALGSPLPSPTIHPRASHPPSQGDIFVMDEAESLPAFNLDHIQPVSTRSNVGGPAPTQTMAWKASSSVRTDMKAIMAEAANDKMSQLLIHTPFQRATILSGCETDTRLGAQSKFDQRTAQGARHKPQSSIAASPGDRNAGPWRIPSIQSEPSHIDPIDYPPPLETLVDAPSSITRVKEPISTTGTTSVAKEPTLQSQRRQPALGPVFTPLRQPVSPSGSPAIRKTLGSKAWTLPPVQAIVESSSSTSGVSLVAIQELQREENASSRKDKQSLRDIQEEEQARQVEADFMKWWSAEEERVKAEGEALAYFRDARQKKSKHQADSRRKAKMKSSMSHPTAPSS